MEVEVAIPVPVPGTFTYLTDEPIAAGTRVIVPFGPRKLVGVVMGAASEPKEGAAERSFQIKPVREVVDEAPVYSSVVLEIAKWLSQYYVHPIGEVLRTMLPAGQNKVKKTVYQLSEKGELVLQEAGHPEKVYLEDLFARKKSALVATVRGKVRKLKEKESRWHNRELEQLVEAGYVEVVRGSTVKARSGEHDKEKRVTKQPNKAEHPLELTPAQRVIFEFIEREGLNGSVPDKPFLLWGLTGSGKTEIYLQLIASAFERAENGLTAQALVLVPEISLTPQMTRVFEARFPGQVAVVHSAMTDGQRWGELSRVRTGDARILIGPRSAVFGPFRDLKLLIVDEEHDSSYKQTTGLAYHGRDIAVLRGRLEKACVVLGSATPSMESYQNAIAGKYHLLQLTERVSGRALPAVDVILTNPADRMGAKLPSGLQKAGDGSDDADIPIDPRVMTALEDNLKSGRQAMVIVNRRGYAYYLFSMTKKKAVACPHCSISLTVHRRSTVLCCHYCDYKTSMQKIVNERQGEQFVTVGYGSEQAEDFLRRRLPGARVVRVDSDTVVKKDMLPTTLAQFRAGEIDILVGTQILAKGHDFPNVTLIVLLEVDQILNLPDFRAGERTFQLIVQAAGRAGRADLPGRVLLQTHRSDHPVVQAGIAQDFFSFAERELEFRKAHLYPPFARMTAIEFNSANRQHLLEFAERVEAWLEQMASLRGDLYRKLQILGPASPPIEVIRGRHRRTILFVSEDVKAVWQVVRQLVDVFKAPPGDIRLKIDVDPQSLI